MAEQVLSTVDEHHQEVAGGMRRRLGRGLSALLGAGPDEQIAPQAAAPDLTVTARSGMRSTAARRARMATSGATRRLIPSPFLLDRTP